MSTTNWNRIGQVAAGVFFIALGIVLLAPFPLDGDWSWGDYIGSPWLSFLLGIPVFLIGLWLLVSGIRAQPKTSQTPSVPLIDEWIGEQGKEEAETSECQRILGADEKLLALVAARGEQELNRLALTDRRIMIYTQGHVQSAVSYDYGQIDKAEGKRNTPLTHLGEIHISTKAEHFSFKNVGIEYVDRIVALISARVSR